MAGASHECEEGHVEMANVDSVEDCAFQCLFHKPDQYPVGGFIVGVSNKKCWCKEGRMFFFNPDLFYLRQSSNTRMWNGQSYQGTYTRKASETDYNVAKCTVVADIKYMSYNFLICPAGEYAAAQWGCGTTSKCSLCPAGQFTEEGINPPETGFGCLNCPLGWRGRPDRTGCDACQAGQYMLDTGACATCPGGQYTNMEGMYFCDRCFPGLYADQPGSDQCEQCPIGRHADESGLSQCKGCQAGKYADAVGHSQCKGCPAGQYGDQKARTSEGDCKECPTGRYADVPGHSQCEDCPAGFYMDRVGQLACTECTAGRASADVGREVCELCPAGSWSDGAKDLLEECQVCLEGKWSSLVGAESELACKHCPHGKCGGEGLAAEEGCQTCEVDKDGYCCPDGQFSQRSVDAKCTPCPRYTYSQDYGECEGDLLWGQPLPESQTVGQIVFRTYGSGWWDGGFRAHLSQGDVEGWNNPEIVVPKGEYFLSRIDDRSVCAGEIQIQGEEAQWGIGLNSPLVDLDGNYTYRCQTSRSLGGILRTA